MTLDLTSLAKAIDRLAEGLERYQREEHDTQIRDGLIQRFEFTYEQCHKTVKRFLEAGSASPGEFDAAYFHHIVRSANEQGLLLGDWPQWRGYRQMRAKTSHTYDEEIALEVVAGIPAFLEDARYLLDQLEQRQI